MKFFKRSFGKCGLGLAAVGALALVSSCEEKQEEAPVAAEQPAAQAPAEKPAAEISAEPAAAPEKEAAPEPTLDELHDNLFDHAIYTLAKKAASPDLFPELNSDTKDLLAMLDQYYNALKKDPEALHDRIRTALLIADITRDLAAYPKALAAYENVLAEVNLLPEEEKKSTDMQRVISLSEGGMGACLLAQARATDALGHYEKALAIDESLYGMVAPPEGQSLPQGDVSPVISQAVVDLLDSYRCLGDCQRAQDDQEEARTTYTKGVKVVTQLRVLSSPMTIAYVKLLTQLGNLENSVGKPQEAFAAWVMAARLCESLNRSSNKLEVKAETKRCFDALLPAIQAVGSKLRAEQEAQKAQAEPGKQEITTEPINAVAPAAEQAPAPAPEPTIAPESAEKPAAKQSEERRRQYKSRRRRSRRD